MTRQEILNYISQNDNIDLSQIELQIDMSKRKERLKAHPYNIWQGKDGKWRTYLPDVRKGRVQRVRSTREEIENLIVEFQANYENSPLIREVFEEWNDRRLRLEQISKSTYVRNGHIFKKHFDVLGEYRIAKVSVYDWCEFLEEQVPRFNMTAKAFANLKGIVKGTVQRAKRRNLITYTAGEIFAELDDELSFKKIVKKDAEEVFNEEETNRIMKYLQDNQDVRNLALLLMFITGMRSGEVVALKHEDIGYNSIFVNRTESAYKMNHKTIYEVKDFPKTEAGVRTVVIPKNFEWLIKKMRLIEPLGEFIFSENGKRIKGKHLRERLSGICKKINIPYRSPHKIRKTYVSILLDNNMDKRFVLDQVGHSCIEVSENWYHRNRKSIETKQEMLDKIAEFS